MATREASTESLDEQPSLSQNDHELEFTIDVEKWKCRICENILTNPVQTSCGHLYCLGCLITFLPEDDTAVKCPVKKEDCQMISRTKGIFSDRCIRNEVADLPVFCFYRIFGCPARVKWKDLKDHKEKCKYKQISCSNPGCPDSFKPEQIEAHSKKCLYRPVPCKYCKHFDTKHNKGCPEQVQECTFTQFGCEFEGTESALEKHHSQTVPQHLEMITVYVANMHLENEDLKNQNHNLKLDLQNAKKEKDILSDKYDQLDKKIANITGIIASHEERLTNVTKKTNDQYTVLTNQYDQHGTKIKICEKVQSNNNELLAKHEDKLDKITPDKLDKLDKIIAENNELQKKQSTQRQEINLLQNTCVVQKDSMESKLNKIELGLKMIENSSYNGVLMWKITEYSKRKTSGFTNYYSQPFYTHRHGYKMCGRVFLNGDGLGQNTHISLFLVIMRGEHDALLNWPFKERVTLMILDQETKTDHVMDSFRPNPNNPDSFNRPNSNMNSGSGTPLFVPQSTIENSPHKYLVDDTLFIKIIVDIENIQHP